MRGQEQVVELRSRVERQAGTAEVFGNLLGEQPQLDVCFLGQPLQQVERGVVADVVPLAVEI